MKPKIIILLFTFLVAVNFNLKAWTSSNEGVACTMDTLVILSDDISYNSIDEMYEVDCDIVILENDTLNNNYPNPFSQYTTIKFEVKNPNTIVNLFIYDSNGNKVNEGIYFYSLIVNNKIISTKKLIFVQ
ncbi:MAG: hypothetical protein H8D45_17085 [Bacteroidetes bacterium]|nr:hypothetical protein [Bacteroidota bacterium]MBL7105941.1 hypothetical protein [Bacteroidales bacterium]